MVPPLSPEDFVLNVILMIIFRGALDAGFHWPGEITLCHSLQNVPHQDEVLVKSEEQGKRRLIQDAALLPPRDDRHHHRLCQADDQQHAFRGFFLFSLNQN